MNEQAWALVHASTAVLLRRHAAGTLLPGVCRLEEVEFEREALEEARLTAGTPPSAAYDIGARRSRSRAVYSHAPPRRRNVRGRGHVHGAWLRAASLAAVLSLTFGAQDAARQTLYRLHPTLYGLLLPDLPAEEKAAAQQVVLQSLDIIAASRDVHAPIAGEGYLVKAITGLLASTVLDSSFRNALNNKWTSPHVIAGLRAHGSLHPDEAAVLAMLTSRDAAGRARLGLHLCGLTSCTKREVIQGQFAVCSACKSSACDTPSRFFVVIAFLMHRCSSQSRIVARSTARSTGRSTSRSAKSWCKRWRCFRPQRKPSRPRRRRKPSGNYSAISCH